MPNNSLSTLSQAILQTIIYSDVFDYPLTLPEIHQYLVGVKVSQEELRQALERDENLAHPEIYFTLPGRKDIVEIRKHREAYSKRLLPVALKYGRVLGSLPFIRMVALTGSLAVMNVSTNADFDYMLVAAPGRVWTARAFALLFNRMTRIFGHTLCPNLIVSETALEWRVHDLYSARELCQMIPITGMDVYWRLMQANQWIKEFLPNAFMDSDSLLPKSQKQAFGIQNIFEWFLRGKLGDRFEGWEMKRKISRFSKQEGFGEETVFNAEVCQGNFDHHHKWTKKVFDEKLNELCMEAPLPRGEGLG